MFVCLTGRGKIFGRLFFQRKSYIPIKCCAYFLDPLPKLAALPLCEFLPLVFWRHADFSLYLLTLIVMKTSNPRRRSKLHLPRQNSSLPSKRYDSSFHLYYFCSRPFQFGFSFFRSFHRTQLYSL